MVFFFLSLEMRTKSTKDYFVGSLAKKEKETFFFFHFISICCLTNAENMSIDHTI